MFKAQPNQEPEGPQRTPTMRSLRPYYLLAERLSGALNNGSWAKRDMREAINGISKLRPRSELLNRGQVLEWLEQTVSPILLAHNIAIGVVPTSKEWQFGFGKVQDRPVESYGSGQCPIEVYRLEEVHPSTTPGLILGSKVFHCPVQQEEMQGELIKEAEILGSRKGEDRFEVDLDLLRIACEDWTKSFLVHLAHRTLIKRESLGPEKWRDILSQNNPDGVSPYIQTRDPQLQGSNAASQIPATKQRALAHLDALWSASINIDSDFHINGFDSRRLFTSRFLYVLFKGFQSNLDSTETPSLDYLAASWFTSILSEAAPRIALKLSIMHTLDKTHAESLRDAEARIKTLRDEPMELFLTLLELMKDESQEVTRPLFIFLNSGHKALFGSD